MAITKKPVKISSNMAKAADDFISGAPDATAVTQEKTPRRVHKGKKVQITLTITEPLLMSVDDLAKQLGQSRAAVINLAVMQMLQTGIRIGSSE